MRYIFSSFLIIINTLCLFSQENKFFPKFSDSIKVNEVLNYQKKDVFSLKIQKLQEESTTSVIVRFTNKFEKPIWVLNNFIHETSKNNIWTKISFSGYDLDESVQITKIKKGKEMIFDLGEIKDNTKSLTLILSFLVDVNLLGNSEKKCIFSRKKSKNIKNLASDDKLFKRLQFLRVSNFPLDKKTRIVKLEIN